MNKYAKKVKASQWKRGFREIEEIKPNRNEAFGFYSTKEQLALRPRKNLMNIINMNNSVTGPNKVSNVLTHIDNYCRGLIT